MRLTVTHYPTLIISIGGLGREGGAAAVVTMSYDYGGDWPPGLIFVEIDAAEDTGRQADGLFSRLPQALPNRHFKLILQDRNIAAIGGADLDPEISGDPAFRELYAVVPPKVLAAGPADTGAIGAYQRPAIGTALFILDFEQVRKVINSALEQLLIIAGNNRAEVVTVGGANGAIGSSISLPVARYAKHRVRSRPQWRTSLVLLGAHPDGCTPDPVAASAIMYALLKDLAFSCKA